MKYNLYNKMLKYCQSYLIKHYEDNGNARRLEHIDFIADRIKERGGDILENEKDYITIAYKYCLFG